MPPRRKLNVRRRDTEGNSEPRVVEHIDTPQQHVSRIGDIIPVQNLERYRNEFAAVPVLFPHFADLDHLENDLLYPRCPHFKHQDLEQFLGANSAYNEDLIRAFYCQLSNGNDHNAVIMFKNGPLVINEDVWFRVFGLRCEGITLTGYACTEGYNVGTFLQEILLVPHADNMTFSQLFAGKIKPEYRIMLWIISKCLDVRASNFSRVLEFDAYLLWLILNNQKINWPHWIMNKMRRARTDNNNGLPYAFIITAFLRYFGAIISTDYLVHPKGDSGLSSTILNKIKVYRDYTGKWVYLDASGSASRLDPPPGWFVDYQRASEARFQEFRDEQVGRFDQLQVRQDEHFAALRALISGSQHQPGPSLTPPPP